MRTPLGGTMSGLRMASTNRLTIGIALTALAGGSVVLANFATAASGPSALDYAQCSNGPPVANVTVPTDCPGGWINGILNASNSQYREDQVTPQRLLVSFPDTGTNRMHSVTLKYLDRKASIHAYDSLASVDATQTDAVAHRCDPLPVTSCPAGLGTGGAPDTTAVVADPTVLAPFSNSISGVTSTVSTHQRSGTDAQLKLFGATFVTGNPASTQGYPANTAPPAMSTPVHDCTATSSCGTSGDDYATTTISFVTPSGNGPHKVQLLFGGHLAVGAQPNGSDAPRGWGPGNGSSAVSGGPYHIKWAGADGGSVGNRDNQIMSGAIKQIVAQGSTMASTTTPTSGNVVVDASSLGTIHDQANLTVNSTSHPPTGTASFSLYGPFTSAPAAGDCVDPDPTHSIDGNVVAGPFTGGAWAQEGTSTTYDSDMASTDYVDLTATTNFAADQYYEWVASYVAGSDLYNAASNSGCTNAFEQIHVIKASPGATSTQTIYDTVTMSGGDSPSGTVDWYLYSALADCTDDVTANAVDTDVTGSATGSDDDTNNTLASGEATSKGFAPTPEAGGTQYWWKVYYNGDSNNNAGFVEDCEVQEVNVQNEAAPPPPTP